MLTTSQREKLIELWGEQGMPRSIAERQAERVHVGELGMDDALAGRLGNLRGVLSDAKFYDLFDAAQIARTFEDLPGDWKEVIESGEADLSAPR